jgi:hypothetical protein
MAWAHCKNGWYKDSKEVTGGKPGEVEKEQKRDQGGWMMLNRFEERGCEKMENKRSEPIRLIICSEGSQGHISRAAELQEDHIRFRMSE